jgi:RimJ/RimL family protein N-acetyltransferase
MCALITWAHREWSLSQVVVRVVEDNIANRRLVESLERFEPFGDTTEVKWPEGKGGGSLRGGT